MRKLNIGLLTAFAVVSTQFCAMSQPLAQTQTVSIIIVRHAEVDTSQPTVPLTAATVESVSPRRRFVSQPGSTVQSESVNATQSPLAARIPAFRAPDTPRFTRFVSIRMDRFG